LINVTVTPGNGSGQVFVSYMTQDMSARAGQDFLGKSDVLVWDGNDTSIRTISLIILGSDSPESEEDFAVILNNPSTGSVVGSPNTAVVTIFGHVPPGTGVEITIQMFMDASSVPQGSTARRNLV
jgi:hypothetical protein